MRLLIFPTALWFNFTTYCSASFRDKQSWSSPNSRNTPENTPSRRSWHYCLYIFSRDLWVMCSGALPEFHRWRTTWWKVTSEGGTQIKNSTLSKEPRSRFCVLESAMAQTWERSFRATASWMGRISCHSTQYSVSKHNWTVYKKCWRYLFKKGVRIHTKTRFTGTCGFRAVSRWF